MPQKIYTVSYLKGDHWEHAGFSSYTSESDAIEWVKEHFRAGKSAQGSHFQWHTYSGTQFRIYKAADGNSWNPTIVEVGPDDKRPMMAVAMYKILEAYIHSDAPAEGEKAAV